MTRDVQVSLILAAILSVVLVRGAIALAMRRGTLDVPNARSSHTVPTPRGGGVGLLAAFAIGGVLMLGVPRATEVARITGAVPAAVAVLLVALVGWWDDHGGIPVRLRLAAHIVAGGLVVPLATVGGPAWGLAAWILMAWWALWVVSSINVVNFIDGIDGLIGLQAVVFGLHLLSAGHPSGAASVFGALLAGASAGFLLWNWSPARIFLGDVGSGALGVLAVVGGALLVREGRYGFVTAFLPLAPIFLDASVTLVARARRGERLSEAHRAHLYQRLANGGMGHPLVSLLYGVAALACLLVAQAWPTGGIPLVLPLVFGLACAGWSLARVLRILPATR